MTTKCQISIWRFVRSKLKMMKITRESSIGTSSWVMTGIQVEIGAFDRKFGR